MIRTNGSPPIEDFDELLDFFSPITLEDKTNYPDDWVCNEAILILESDQNAEEVWKRLQTQSTEVICTFLTSSVDFLGGEHPALFILIGDFDRVLGVLERTRL